jgi:Holliday junction resolvase RusA-like endonuclease
MAPPIAPWHRLDVLEQHTLVSAPQRPVEFIAYGKAEPKGSARGFVLPVKDGSKRPVLDKHGKPKYRAVITAANPNSKEWERTVRHCAATAGIGRFFEGAVEVRILFGILRPESVSVKKRPHPTVKPDVDKLTRTVFDAISSVLYRDDAQVVHLQVRKVYVVDGPPYAQVWVGDATDEWVTSR